MTANDPRTPGPTSHNPDATARYSSGDGSAQEWQTAQAGQAYRQPGYDQQYYGQPGYNAQATYGNPQQYSQPGYDPQAQQQYAQPGYGQPYEYGFTQPGAVPGPELASWGARAGARIIDTLVFSIPLGIVMGIGAFMAFHDAQEVRHLDGTSSLEGVKSSGIFVLLFGMLLGIFFNAWNLGIRQGKTGQSIGKKLLHLRVIDERSGAPTGAGRGLGRYGVELAFSIISSFVGFLTLLDLLWPLWDKKNQTLHDKALNTVVVRAPRR